MRWASCDAHLLAVTTLSPPYDCLETAINHLHSSPFISPFFVFCLVHGDPALPNVHSKALLRVQLVRLPPLPSPDLPQHTWQMREDIGRLGRESNQKHHMIRLELVAVKNCGTPSYLYHLSLDDPLIYNIYISWTVRSSQNHKSGQ